MAFINDYAPENYRVVFDVQDGHHIVTIAGARATTNKDKTRQMIEVAYRCEESKGFYYDYYVEGDYFNQNMTKFFDSFNIERGNFNFDSWKGARAKAFFKHEEQSYIGSNGEQKTVNKCLMKYLCLPGESESKPAPQLPPKKPQSDFPKDISF